MSAMTLEKESNAFKAREGDGGLAKAVPASLSSDCRRCN